MASTIPGVERLLQVSGDTIKWGLFDVGKLLHQLHLNHSSAGPSPIATAICSWLA
jgi:hypothetical protein